MLDCAGVPATELQLPTKRMKVKQEAEAELQPAAEDDLPGGAEASEEASDEQQAEGVKHADGDAAPEGPPSGGASWVS